ncbi:hypothetical protein C0989_003518 [Termitomyces sp. Mn162]|nr:hypothetical protein C0989_003518 [Termitomyces sp. Mn162]
MVLLHRESKQKPLQLYLLFSALSAIVLSGLPLEISFCIPRTRASSGHKAHFIGHYSRPTPALLNAIYLWGTYLAPSPHDGCDEKAFLRNSLHHLSKDLSCSHPHKIIQGIQTEVLLSYYYLMNGKVLAGNYHANAAVSLCLSSGFHRIRTPIGPAIFSSTSRSSPPQPSSPLPKAVDDIEEGERVDAFWAVLILNNTWIAIQESHSMFYDLQTIGVDTPWPMDTFEYQLQLLPSVSSGTIKGFLDSTNIEGFSIMALHAKAAVLLEQATIYASNPEASDQRPSEISRLEAVIDQFQSQFPMVDRMDVTPSETDTLLMTQMMIHAATIKLHLPLLQKGETRSRQKTLAAAQAIAVLTHSIQPMSSIRVDPIVGVSTLDSSKRSIHTRALWAGFCNHGKQTTIAMVYIAPFYLVADDKILRKKRPHE